MAEGGFNWGDFAKNYGPWIATGIGAFAGRSGQQTPTQTLQNADPRLQQLLNQLLQERSRLQPTREAAQNAQFAMLPSWARSSASLPAASAPTPQSSYPAANTIGLPSGGGNHTLAKIGSGVGLGAMAGAPFLAAVPWLGPALMGADAVVNLARRLGGNQTNRAREQFAAQFTGSKELNDFWPWLQQHVDPNAYAQLYDTAAHQIGRNDTTANEAWMRAVINALGGGRG